MRASVSSSTGTPTVLDTEADKKECQMIVGYLSDSFDLLNIRDLDLVEQAAELCDRLVLGVHTDDYAEELTGRRPVVPLEERLALTAQLRGVAAVSPHDAATPPPSGSLHLVTSADLAAGSHLLTSRRDTASPLLRAALRPTSAAADADPAEAVA